ncbi:MAG: hypothetical protein AB8F78_17610 [Saprospiraceae bacterium]
MRFTLLFLAIALFSVFATAQTLEELTADPTVLAEAYIRGQVLPIDSALTGEAAENPISLRKLPRSPRTKTIPHWRKDGRALVAIEFSNSNSAEDLYMFLDSTSRGWRISALRQFNLPGVYYQQLNHYRNKGERSIREDYNAKMKSSMERGVTQAQHEEIHGTLEDRIFYVFNLRLTSSSDGDLIRHFDYLRKKFDAVRMAMDSIPKSPIALYHDNALVGKDLQYLLVKRAFNGEGPIRFEIAAIGGDDVGFLYCNSPECMPTPTPGGLIAFRSMGGGWWLYRTT